MFLPILLLFTLFFHIGNLSAQVFVHQENFNTGIGTWSSVNISDVTDVWTPTTNYMEIDGSGGADDEDWLISPAINMDAQTEEFFMFDYFDANNGNFVELVYSSNYNNGGTPADIAAATWTNLPLKLIDLNATPCFNIDFQRHPAIDVGMVTGTAVYFAFKYTGVSSNSKLYRIDNVHIDANYFVNITPGANCAALKQELHDLIAVQADRIRYSSSSQYDVWDAIMHTDTRLNDAGTATIVWDMFTDRPTATGEVEYNHCTHRDQGSCPGGEGNCYNREHTFPRSWWGGGTTLSDTINTDMHHIYASDRSLNSSKSNYPPGMVTSPVTTGSNGWLMGANASYPCTPATGSKRYFEPLDEFKGDYARTYFYVVTRYQHNMAAWQGLSSQGNCFIDGTTYPSIQNWAMQVLLQWHAQDPVSQKEIDHNRAVYAIQGNWNPYIYTPGYVYLVWGDENGTPCNTIVLPVELLSFDAAIEREAVKINWATSSENNNDYFLVERSNDLMNWEEVAFVSGAGNSTEEITYSESDYFPLAGNSYYRLKQVDFDGEYSYSEIRPINFGSDQDLVFYPNPVKDVLTIKGNIDDLGQVQVFDLLGRDVTSLISFEYMNGQEVRLRMDNLSADVYIVKTNLGQYRVVKK
ncbi:MAG TPA: T9SS type A sorting domain-containing protein [Crocinitomicaceae bacterium]|nr:T9SS type A sorting domain-containing protein [Crocinitomicaceae bacterium]